MTTVAFNKLLHGLRVQYKIGDTWLLYQDYADKGYTLSRTFYVSDRISSVHTYWTQRGRWFLYGLLGDIGILPLGEKANVALGGVSNTG
jgi:hypothetical protein